MKKHWKQRLFAFTTALLLTVNMIPVDVFAAEPEEESILEIDEGSEPVSVDDTTEEVVETTGESDIPESVTDEKGADGTNTITKAVRENVLENTDSKAVNEGETSISENKLGNEITDTEEQDSEKEEEIVVDTSGWNGFHQDPNSDAWYYYKNGKPDTSLSDIIKGVVNGEKAWWHIVKGRVSFETTVAKNSKGWWYIKEGKVDFSYNGMASNSNGTWKITNGKVTFKDTGVIKVNGTWYNLTKSKVVTGPTVAKNKNGWWYIIPQEK